MERSLNRTSLWAITGDPLTKRVGIAALCQEFSWYKTLWFWRTTQSELNIVRFFRNRKFNFVSKFYVCIRITTTTWSLDETVSHCSSIPCTLHHGRKGNTLALCSEGRGFKYLPNTDLGLFGLRHCHEAIHRSNCFLLPHLSQWFADHSNRRRCINCAGVWKCRQSSYRIDSVHLKCWDKLQERVLHICTKRNVHFNICPEMSSLWVWLED